MRLCRTCPDSAATANGTSCPPSRCSSSASKRALSLRLRVAATRSDVATSSARFTEAFSQHDLLACAAREPNIGVCAARGLALEDVACDQPHAYGVARMTAEESQRIRVQIAPLFAPDAEASATRSNHDVMLALPPTRQRAPVVRADRQ